MNSKLPAPIIVLESGAGSVRRIEGFAEIAGEPPGGRFVTGQAGDGGGRVHALQNSPFAFGPRNGYLGACDDRKTPNPPRLKHLALARRSGWPDDLRVLIARYPREQWDAHANLGEMARFWLSRHAMFRELSRCNRADHGAISCRQPAAGRIRPAVRTPAAIHARPAQRPSSDRGLALFPNFSRGGRAAWRAALTSWKVIITTSTPTWRALRKTPMRYCRHCGAMSTPFADAAMPMRIERRIAQGADPPPRRRRGSDRAADPRSRRGSARRRAPRLAVMLAPELVPFEILDLALVLLRGSSCSVKVPRLRRLPVRGFFLRE